MLTTNSPRLGAGFINPKQTGAAIPRAQNVDVLLRVHRHQVAQLHVPAVPEPDGGDPVERFERRQREVLARQEREGIFRIDAGRGTYRFTGRGAWRAVARLRMPWKLWFLYRRAVRMRRLLTAVGVPAEFRAE